MRYLGHVKNGVIVLDGEMPIPDGTAVTVEALVAPGSEGEEDSQAPTLAELFAPFIGVIKDLPEDFAINHDHYIHGTPKKYPSK